MAEREQERIFDRTWQLVGHVTDLPNPGSRIVGSIGRREVVVVRTEDGAIKAHLNTCRHRGTRLVSEPGEEKALRCPYHGWTYHLDGTLVGAPENRTIPCLDKSKLSLFGARAEVFCGLIFVNLDLDAAPLAPQLEGVRELLERYLGGDMEPFGDARIHVSDASHVQNSNWKVAIDNYLEGYHVPVAHPGLMRLLDYKHYAVETTDAYVVYDAPLRDKPSDNWAERMYQRNDPADARARRRGRARLPLHRHLPEHRHRPVSRPRSALEDEPTGRGPGRRARHVSSSRDCDARTRIAQKLNLYVSQITNHEDEDLVQRMQIGLGNTDFEPGPLSLRERAWRGSPTASAGSRLDRRPGRSVLR